jgi:Family of unknown function (DUF6152)
MNSRLMFLIGAVAAIVLALSPSPLGAHHGWAGNGEPEFEVTGTVEKAVSLAGPHATMQVRAEGKVWDVTLAPPARTERAGLTEKVIPVGATVTVHGHRNSDPNKFEIKTERVTFNGKTFNVYPDRK